MKRDMGGAVRRFVFVLTSLLATFAARAESAAEMRSYCQPIISAQVAADGKIGVQPTFEAGICWGAISSPQKMSRYVDGASKPIFHICAPEQSTLSQFATIFSTYADKHPERLHEYWLTLALQALQEAFPCS
jgi:hypothetical protein